MRQIEVRDLTTHYGMALILDGISMHLDDGEIVTLIGSNGAGKSTLLKTLIGLVTPTSGTITFRGEEIQGKHPHYTAKLGIAYIPEDRCLFTSMTVKENLELGAYLHQTQKEELLSQVLTIFPVLRELLDRQASSLSGGERQMLNMAMGMMSEPRLYLIDEPSLGLSPIVVETLFQTITEINKSGVTVLLVEQDANLALQVASRGYVLENGRITMEGKAVELLGNKHVQRAYLGLA